MSERTFIINRSTTVVVEDTRTTGGHGYEFEERPLTFMGTNNPPPEAIKISMAPNNLRDEIFDTWKHISPLSKQYQKTPPTTAQDI